MDGNLAMNSHFENMSEKDSNDMADHYIILEGNKLIAEFLGWEFIKDSGDPHVYKDHYLVRFEGRDMWQDNQYAVDRVLLEGHAFHQKWEKLMPVVEKISRIEFDRKYDEDQKKWVIWTHHPVTFGMLDEYGRPMVRFYCSPLHFGKTLIEATWNAVVDFIKSNNSKP